MKIVSGPGMMVTTMSNDPTSLLSHDRLLTQEQHFTVAGAALKQVVEKKAHNVDNNHGTIEEMHRFSGTEKQTTPRGL